MTAESLLDFILSLLRDPQAQQEFRDDPSGTLERNGFQGLCGQDVADALPLVIDDSRVSSYEIGNSNVAVHPVVPPPPSPHPMPGETGMDTVIRQFDYITNTYVYTDSHNTVLDNSVNQNIWADGDVWQMFDNDPLIASGEGSVAAGDDIDGTVTTGDGNVVGDDNMISTGDGATAFGDGDAYAVDDVEIDDGGALAVDGDATGNSTPTDNSTNADITSFGEGEVAVGGTNGTASQDDVDSNNSVDSNDTIDSNNTDSHDDIASNNDIDSNDTIDSNNVDSHDDVNSNNEVDGDVDVDGDVVGVEVVEDVPVLLP
ncbi:MAG: IniB N-terminal domain-containing protein [Kibdelosporangium sp.]